MRDFLPGLTTPRRIGSFGVKAEAQKPPYVASAFPFATVDHWLVSVARL